MDKETYEAIMAVLRKLEETIIATADRIEARMKAEEQQQSLPGDLG